MQSLPRIGGIGGLILVLGLAFADGAATLAQPANAQDRPEAVSRHAPVAEAQAISPFSQIGAANGNSSAKDSVVQSRRVRINFEKLADLQAGRRIAVDLFGGLSVSGIVVGRNERSTARFTLYGRFDNVIGGEFVLAVNGEAVAGVFRAGALGTYRLRFTPDGFHVLEKLNRQRETDCLTGDGAFSRGEGGGEEALAGECDDGSVIDVLVVYTPAARDEAGGVAAIEAQIDLANQHMNLAFVNSEVETLMNLVYVWQVDVSENDAGLTSLTDPDDGVMDGVHTLRDVYGADQVVLIATGGGGVANGLWNLDPGSEAMAFCVVGLDSLLDLVFAHELGHNLGCCHALGDGGGCPAEGGLLFPYSNGHRFDGDGGELWRTVMAYSPGERITHFSNSAILFDGQPTGVPVDEPDAAENAQTINLAAFTVANWRCNDGICEALDLPSDAEDCNGNEVPDACDIAMGQSEDQNNNGIPDECELIGDIDGDGIVGAGDLILLLGAWGSCDECAACPADLDGDCTVGTADLILLLGNWE